MKTKNTAIKSLLTACLFFVTAGECLAGSQQLSEKINPYLQTVMASASDNEMIPVYIKFKQNLTLQNFDDISYDTPKKKEGK